MELLDWIIVGLFGAVAVSTGGLFAGFAAYGSFKRLYEDEAVWLTVPTGMKVTALIVSLFALVSDPIFNWTRGAWIFREAPWKGRTIMFTQRIQLHINESMNPRDLRVAIEWADIANIIDPGHIRHVRIAQLRLESLTK